MRVADQKLELVHMRRDRTVLVGDTGNSHRVPDRVSGKRLAHVWRIGQKYLERVRVVSHAEIGSAKIRPDLDHLALGDHELPEALQVLHLDQAVSE